MKAAPDRQITYDYFDRTAAYWDDIYQKTDLQSVIYQDRKRAILDLIGRTGLPAGSPILEIGCGAGHLAVELATRGFDVTAIDAAPAMVRLTTERAQNLGTRLSASLGSVEKLEYPAGRFALVLAVGVLPWLDSIEEPLREMARVAGSGAFVLATADHAGALQRWIDPRLHPVMVSAKRGLRRLLERSGSIGPLARGRLQYRRQVDRALAQAGLEKRMEAMVGFGPFTFCEYPLLSNRTGVALHRRLQRHAEQGAPLVKSIGAHYIVLGRKKETTS